MPQCRRVVPAEALDVVGLERRPLERELDPREGERLAVGEHVSGREDVLERVVVRAEHGDPVVEQDAGRLEQLRERLGVAVDLVLADVLDHADARDRVERLVGDLPVVGDADLDPVGQAERGDPLAAERGLLVGDRDPENLGPVFAGRVDREAAPAAADVEDAVALLEAELGRDEVELGPLGLLEGLGAAGEDRAAVGHRRVEEQREEVVADVVVVADRLLVAVDRVPLAVEDQLELGRLRAAPTAGTSRGRRPSGGRGRRRRSAVAPTCRRR